MNALWREAALTTSKNKDEGHSYTHYRDLGDPLAGLQLVKRVQNSLLPLYFYYMDTCYILIYANMCIDDTYP